MNNWHQAHANKLILSLIWCYDKRKKENFEVKYYFYDQSYQFSEVLFLVGMLHFPKCSSSTPDDNNNNLF